MTRIRDEREARGWTRETMATRLRQAAADPAALPNHNSLLHSIYRWERGYGMRERYRMLYCRAFNLSHGELFGPTPRPTEPPNGRGDGDSLVVVLPPGTRKVIITMAAPGDGDGPQPVRRLRAIRNGTTTQAGRP